LTGPAAATDFHGEVPVTGMDMTVSSGNLALVNELRDAAKTGAMVTPLRSRIENLLGRIAQVGNLASVAEFSVRQRRQPVSTEA